MKRDKLNNRELAWLGKAVAGLHNIFYDKHMGTKLNNKMLGVAKIKLLLWMLFNNKNISLTFSQVAKDSKTSPVPTSDTLKGLIELKLIEKDITKKKFIVVL